MSRLLEITGVCLRPDRLLGFATLLVLLPGYARASEAMLIPEGDRAMIENACAVKRQFHGPAAYRQCVREQVSNLELAGPPADLSGMSPDDRAMIENACAVKRQFHGPAAYRQCVREQVSKLASSGGAADLSGISPDDLAMIESACAVKRQFHGPAAYRSCVREQVSEFDLAGESVEMTGVSSDDRALIENACAVKRQFHGPAAYRYCVREEVLKLKSEGALPDLSGLSPDDREMIESACAVARMFRGPAAYRQCVREQAVAVEQGEALPDEVLPQGAAPVGSSSLPSKKTIAAPVSKQASQTRLAEPRFDFGSATALEVDAIINVCESKLATNQAIQNCMREQVEALEKAGTPPDFAGVDTALDQEIHRLCNPQWTALGPAAYYGCLRTKLTAAEGLAKPLVPIAGIPDERMKAAVAPQNRSSRLASALALCLLAGLVGVGWRFVTTAPCHACGERTSNPSRFCSKCAASIRDDQRRADSEDAGRRQKEARQRRVAEQEEHRRRDAEERAQRAREAEDQARRAREAEEEKRRKREAEEARRASSQRGPGANGPFDPYAVLKIRRGASRAEIKKAFHREMALYHPDKVAHLGPELQEVARKKALEINQAFQMLDQ